ncbi:MAG TPA: hypothetical protein VLF93_02155 [Candidatus Saccharimonadales bacterium]|nr:hypothetical protein [Candidatus Saccharimonadales bacterium]
MAVPVEAKNRRLDVRVVTTPQKDRPNVKPAETLVGKAGELMLGVPLEITGFAPLQGTGLRTKEILNGPSEGSCEASCPRVSRCQGGSCDFTHCRGDPSCR